MKKLVIILGLIFLMVALGFVTSVGQTYTTGTLKAIEKVKIGGSASADIGEINLGVDDNLYYWDEDGGAFVKFGTMSGTTDDLTEGSTNLYNRIPSGGTTGQLLNKTAGTDYALGWVNPQFSASTYGIERLTGNLGVGVVASEFHKLNVRGTAQLFGGLYFVEDTTRILINDNLYFHLTGTNSLFWGNGSGSGIDAGGTSNVVVFGNGSINAGAFLADNITLFGNTLAPSSVIASNLSIFGNGAGGLYGGADGNAFFGNGNFGNLADNKGGNVGVGINGGKYCSNGSTALTDVINSTYLGYNINSGTATDAGVDNEIIIGSNATGNGSNTATIGDDNVTDFWFGDGTTSVAHFSILRINNATVWNATGNRVKAGSDAGGGGGSVVVAVGDNSLSGAIDADFTVGVGGNSGRYISNGSTAYTAVKNSTFVGYNTKSGASTDALQTNENVFGYDATGNGANTVTLGDDNITDVYAGENGTADLNAANVGTIVGLYDPANTISTASATKGYTVGTWTTSVNAGFTLSGDTGIIVPTTGNYEIFISASFEHSNSNVTVDCAAYNSTDNTEIAAVHFERLIGTGAQIGDAGAANFAALTASDRVTVRCMADKTGTLSFNHAQFKIERK